MEMSKMGKFNNKNKRKKGREILLMSLMVLSLFSFTMCGNQNGKTDTAVTIKTDSKTSTIAATKSGKVEGIIKDGIYTYRGIDYAEAQRFMAPKKVASWEGVKKAVEYGNICPQAQNNSRSEWFAGPDLKQSDSCQNLNIWTPGLKEGKKRAVMVWLHGGGFSSGSSIENYFYDGENLSRTGDVVVVSINHRLNSMGFLDLSAYGEKYRDSANTGIMDLVAALEWIRDNIEEFGGNPDNVTIFGESGGGAKVLTLMATPAAKGLFHKAVSESGAVEEMGMTLLPEKATRRVGELTLEYLGLNSSDIDKIEALPYEKILEATRKALAKTAEEQGYKNVLTGATGLDWAPKLDSYIPVEPVGEKYSEQSRDIPLLIGTNLTEWETIPLMMGNNESIKDGNRNTWTEEQVKVKMKEKYGERAEKIAEAFSKAYPERKPADALYVDSLLRKQTLKTARLKADQKGAPVYNYIFSWDTTAMDGIPMSYHTAEIPFVFNSIKMNEKTTNGTEEAYELARKVSQAWVNFAKTGVPSAEGLPKWEPYTRENGAVMILDNKSEMKYNHEEELIRLLAPGYNF